MASAPAEEAVRYFADNRVELLAQSLLFVLSAGIFLWFLGSLRTYLVRAEGGTGRLSSVVFAAGVAWITINAATQAPQIALALASDTAVEPGLGGMISDLAYAFFTISYIPLAVMLAAVAVVSLRTGAFPAWLGWLTAVTAAVNLVLSFGIVADSGPLVPGAWLTYVPFPLFALWVVAATTVMVRRVGRPAPASSAP